MARRSGEREKVRGPRQAAALHFSAEAPHPSLSPLPRGEGDQPQRFTACYTIERPLTAVPRSYPA